jgi:hypothetical protein
VKGDGLSVLKRDDEVLESRRKLMGSCILVERRWGLATLEKGDGNLQCWRKEMGPCNLGKRSWALSLKLR